MGNYYIQAIRILNKETKNAFQLATECGNFLEKQNP